MKTSKKIIHSHDFNFAGSFQADYKNNLLFTRIPSRIYKSLIWENKVLPKCQPGVMPQLVFLKPLFTFLLITDMIITKERERVTAFDCINLYFWR